MLNKLLNINSSYLKSFLLILLIVIIFSPEQSLAPAISLEKLSYWSPYNFKLGIFTIIDYVFVFFSFLLLYKFAFSSLNLGKFNQLFLFYLIFLIIGIIYNIFINFSTKAFFFDLKTISYFLLTYLILINFLPNLRFNINYFLAILLIIFLGSFFDNFIINKFYKPQYTSQFFSKIYFKNEIYPALLVGLCFFNKFNIKIKLILFFILGFYVFLYYDTYSLGALYVSLVSIYIGILIFFFYQYKGTKNYLVFFFIFLNIFLLIHILPVLMIFIKNYFSGVKVDGWLIRELEFFNFIKNSLSDFTIIFGKGIGATWNEYFTSLYTNIYSTGPFYKEYKYIWHSSIARQFFMWGIFGYAFLVYFIYSVFYKLSKKKNTKNNLLSFYLVTIVYIVLISPGILKISIIAGIILFFIERELYYKTNNES
tara:strand:- start:460 stop:1731 length:1272 start_codon:yes stop_codon:yes gene_type:complete